MLHQVIKSANNEVITFNDGLLLGLKETGGHITAAVGQPLACGSKTVGVNRFHQARVHDAIVTAVVAVPLAQALEQGLKNCRLFELALFKEPSPKIYSIYQFQEKADAKPPCMLVSLKEVVVKYDEQRPSDQCLAGLRYSSGGAGLS